MTEGRTARNTTTRYRYSIKQLENLSRTTYGTFDLSKFSYEAARAGVIPQLNDYAMTARKSSAHPPRGWSGDSSSTGEGEQARDSQYGMAPMRSPAIPPIGLRAQDDFGFVRFLKKHSSPTHQRVTAGGRIVPMETRLSPPAFRLVSGSRRSNCLPDDRSIEDTHRVSSSLIPRPQIKIMESSKSSNQDTDRLHAEEHCLSLHTSTQLDWVGLEQVPGMTAPKAEMSQNDSTQYHASNSVMTPSPTNMATAMSSAGLLRTPHYLGQDIITEQSMAAQTSLGYWSHCYEELDLQLKTLDRQRAMTALTAEMANQRKAIVQQRSDTKDIIKKISAFLGLSEQASALYQQGQLNVNAPLYVPQVQNLHQNGLNSSEETDNSCRKELDYIQPPGARRPIPIVAPPELEAEKKMVPEVVAPYIQQDITDQWGVKIGTAPSRLQRHQSKLAETLINEVREQCSPSSVSFGKLKQSPHRSFSENDAYRFLDEESGSDPGSAVNRAPRRAPPTIEADYAKQLDALRMGRGSVTMVHLNDGSTMAVTGQAMKRPPSAEMSDFEKLYWSDVQVRDHPAPGLEPGVVDCWGPQSNEPVEAGNRMNFGGTATPEKAQCPLALENWPSSSGEVSHISGLAVSSSQCKARVQSITGIPTNLGELREPQVHGEVYFSTQYGNQEVAKTSKFAEHENGPHLQQDYTPRSDVAQSMDGLYNKGYTSASVQNIHAAAPFPFLDGTSEVGRGAKALQGISGRSKSPRVLQRAGQNGSTWFGPFRRGLGE